MAGGAARNQEEDVSPRATTEWREGGVWHPADPGSDSSFAIAMLCDSERVTSPLWVSGFASVK